MFEDKTSNSIHQEMLNDISDDYDKSEGSFIFDATKPQAIQNEKIYKDMDLVISKFDIENLEGDELEKRINQRTGITRKLATKATGILDITGNGTIKIGDIFETQNGIQFASVEEKSITESGTVNIECTQAGSIGNVPANQITLMPVTIAGITSVNNSSPTSGGYEAESDKELLQRYYERIKTPATSGNKTHYKNWAKEVVGVGDAKVFPLWNGDNTVKIVIIDADKKPASSDLVLEVQNHIDPNSLGLGKGVAPIGAYCTIISATELPINISFTATKDNSVSDTERQQSVEENITNYLKEIAFQDNTVSYAKTGALILDSKGILDYTDLLINGGTSNITVTDEEVATLGGVVIG